MYIPKNLEVKDALVISELIAENGFGMLITADLTATHLPLIYQANDAGLGLAFYLVTLPNQIRIGKRLKTSECWSFFKGHMPIFHQVGM